MVLLLLSAVKSIRLLSMMLILPVSLVCAPVFNLTRMQLMSEISSPIICKLHHIALQLSHLHFWMCGSCILFSLFCINIVVLFASPI